LFNIKNIKLLVLVDKQETVSMNVDAARNCVLQMMYHLVDVLTLQTERETTVIRMIDYRAHQ